MKGYRTYVASGGIAILAILHAIITDPVVLKWLMSGETLLIAAAFTYLRAALGSQWSGLLDLVRELLGKELSKQQQSSDWGGPELSDAQREYAASDVRYLHAMQVILAERLEREHRTELAQAAFDFLPYRARLDLAGWAEKDLFSHEG